jgi:hypothetical protein
MEGTGLPAWASPALFTFRPHVNVSLARKDNAFSHNETQRVIVDRAASNRLPDCEARFQRVWQNKHARRLQVFGVRESAAGVNSAF